MIGVERNFGIGILLNIRDGFTAGAQRAERSFAGLSTAADVHAARIEKSMVRIRQSAMMMGVGAAMMAATLAPVKMASDWSYGMAEVSTLVNTATFDMDRFSKGVLRIAAGVGDVSEASRRAAYDLLSGIQGLTETEYLAVYEKAAKAAVAGVSDINTSLKLGMGILNAYGMGVGELDRLYDQLFTTVQLGVTTYSELGGSLGKVLSTAKLARVEVGQVLGGIAALTKAGVSTSEAVTSINSLLMAMAAPEEKASKELERLGGAAYVAARESGNLIEQMRIFAPLVNSLADIRKLTPEREAIRAFGSLTQNLEKFIEIARQTSDPRAGTYLEAFDKMAKEMKKKLEVAGAQLKRFMILIGTPLLSALTPVAEKFGELLEKFGDFAEKHPGLAKGILGVSLAFGALIFTSAAVNAAVGLFNILVIKSAVALGFKIWALKYYTVTAWAAVAPTWALIAPWLVMIGVAALVAGAAYLIIKNWKPISEFFAGLWEGAKDAAVKFYDWLTGFVSGLWEGIKANLGDIGLAALPFIGIPLLIVKHWKPIKGFLLGIVDAVSEKWKAVESFFTRLWSRITGGVRSFVNAIKGIFQKVADFFLAPFRAIWAAIQKVVDYVPNWALPAGLEKLKTAMTTAGAIGITAMASPAMASPAVRPVMPVEYRIPQVMSGTAQLLEREVILQEQLKPDGITKQQAERMIQKFDDFSRKSVEMRASLYLDSDQIAETVSRRQYQRHMERQPR